MEDQDAFLNSVALNLQSFYNGLVRVMEWVALEMDGEHSAACAAQQ